MFDGSFRNKISGIIHPSIIIITHIELPKSLMILLMLS